LSQYHSHSFPILSSDWTTHKPADLLPFFISFYFSYPSSEIISYRSTVPVPNCTTFQTTNKTARESTVFSTVQTTDQSSHVSTFLSTDFSSFFLSAFLKTIIGHHCSYSFTTTVHLLASIPD
jgi:hypothetical protein